MERDGDAVTDRVTLPTAFSTLPMASAGVVGCACAY